jgi:hypothetical protein
VNISLMEKVTVSQIKIQRYLVQVDSPLMDKEIVSGFLYQHILHIILQFQLLIKYLHQLQLQLRLRSILACLTPVCQSFSLYISYLLIALPLLQVQLYQLTADGLRNRFGNKLD